MFIRFTLSLVARSNITVLEYIYISVLEHAMVSVIRVATDELLYNNQDVRNIILAGLLLASFPLHVTSRESPLNAPSAVYFFHSP